MTVPTQPVTINLADFGGEAIEGIIVTATPSEVDYTADGTFVSSEPVKGVTDANGQVVLELFPNATVANGGLGTVGTTIRVTAQLTNSRPLDVLAAIPNQPCNLVDYIVSNEPQGLSGSEGAAARAEAARDVAEADRAQTQLDRAATAADRVQTGLDRVQTTADAAATADDREQTGIDAASASESAASALASATLAVNTGRRIAIFLLTYGQSNGLAQAPAYSSEQLDGLVTFNGGQQPSQFSDYVNSTSLYQNPSNFDSLVPFKEGTAGEGWGTGIGIHLLQDAGVEKILHFSAASIGLAYVQLCEGSSKWGDMMTAMIRGVRLLQAAGYDLDNIEPVFQWVQGEAEANGFLALGDEYITAAQEKAKLTSLAASVNRAWSIAFGRPTTVSIFLWPILCTRLNATGAPNVQEGQLSACNTVPGLIMTTNPCQFLTDINADLVHFGGEGKRLMAEAHGLIMRRVRSGESWKPLQIASASRAGPVITVTFTKDIAIDTTTIAEVSSATYPKQKYGFQFFDDSTELTISGVTVLGKVATVTLSSMPSGSVKRLRLSQHQAAGASPTIVARSNIRATEAIGTASDGTTIYDFAVPQSITVS